MKIYRSHDGLFFGVCMGLEESLGIPAKYSRLVLIILAIIFRAWIILTLYLLAAILMPIRSENDWKIQDNFETLSRDAKRWSRREYDDIREMLRRSSSEKAASEEYYEEEPEPEKKAPKAKTTAKPSAAKPESSTKRSPKDSEKSAE